MTGEKEQKCLDFVKNNIKQECNKNYFGLLEEDREEIENILHIAKANENASKFPDFVFDNGFVEHFQISSSKTTKKGAVHLKEENEFKSRENKEFKDFMQECNKTPSFDEVRSNICSKRNPVHNYRFLVESFETNWNNHIDSLNKYLGNKEVGIFMIEYTDIALTMFERVYGNWLNGMSHGDMRNPEKFNYYRLSRDEKMLNILYKYKEKIKYVIFRYCEGFEIIRLENIPYLLKLLPWEYEILEMDVTTVAATYNISSREKYE